MFSSVWYYCCRNGLQFLPYPRPVVHNERVESCLNLEKAKIISPKWFIDILESRGPDFASFGRSGRVTHAVMFTDFLHFWQSSSFLTIFVFFGAFQRFSSFSSKIQKALENPVVLTPADLRYTRDPLVALFVAEISYVLDGVNKSDGRTKERTRRF